MLRSSLHIPSELGELERELLDLVWLAEEASADALRVKLGRPLKDSTIRTVLRRLEKKGYLTHTTEQRTFLYRAAQTRETVTARAVKHIADWFCDGSMEGLMVGMINSQALALDELQNLSSHISRLRASAKKGTS
jgi:BlaI family transcriptional regulator, penicillinase repressor